VDLHRHLEGSVRFATFLEIAREVGIDLPVAELRRRSSMRGERPGFLRFLSKFQLYRGLYPSREWIERVAFEAAEDARRDGVAHLELRFSCAHFGRRLKAKGEDVAAWVARGARRAGIGVGFIACFGRDFSIAENAPTMRGVEGTGFFSGLDIAGNEARSALPFLPFFRRAGLPVTIHAGEAGGPANVVEAIERFGAVRIGHGVRVLRDRRALLLAKGRGVCFEVCPLSELLTGVARSVESHPVRRMVAAGLRVALSSDDPAVCGSTLSDDFLVARRAGLSMRQLRTASLIAAESAFAPAETRVDLVRRIARAWP
jgi:adenosine deaminase